MKTKNIILKLSDDDLAYYIRILPFNKHVMYNVNTEELGRNARKHKSSKNNVLSYKLTCFIEQTWRWIY